LFFFSFFSRTTLLHITTDLRERWPLALHWLFEEFRFENFEEKDSSETTSMLEEHEEEEADVKPLDLSNRYHYIIMYILDASLGTIDLLQDAMGSLGNFCFFFLLNDSI
jgi:hypothetical protein